MSDFDLVLASASPRRAELLHRLGLRFSIQPADIDETARPDERALDYVKRMAAEKLSTAQAQLGAAPAAAADGAQEDDPGPPVLAADTVVVLGGRILGKPSGPDEAAEMLRSLAGRRHEVITGYRVARGQHSAERAVSTAVSFRLIAADEVAEYVASGEWQGKAGGYAVQGIAAVFASEIRGSFTNVVGLPLAEVIADLRAVGAGALAAARLRGRGVTRAQQIADNLAAVHARIAQAAAAAGRPPASVRLVAVSKTMPADDVAAALAAGQRDFGENYAQELRDKRPALEPAAGAPDGPRWHFIGPLQSNKVKYLAGKVALLHTVDNVGLLEQISRRLAAEAGTGQQDCLVQVNVAGESQKRGVALPALPALLDAFAAHERLRCVGLMAIPPLGEDPEASRPHFQALRRLRDQLSQTRRPRVDLAELSMGMSHDLQVAIAEGATIVRVGTAIFGERRRPAA